MRGKIYFLPLFYFFTSHFDIFKTGKIAGEFPRQPISNDLRYKVEVSAIGLLEKKHLPIRI